MTFITDVNVMHRTIYRNKLGALNRAIWDSVILINAYFFEK